MSKMHAGPGGENDDDDDVEMDIDRLQNTEWRAAAAIS